MGNVEVGRLQVYFHTHIQNKNTMPNNYTYESILNVLQRMYGGKKERNQLKEKDMDRTYIFENSFEIKQSWNLKENENIHYSVKW